MQRAPTFDQYCRAAEPLAVRWLFFLGGRLIEGGDSGAARRWRRRFADGCAIVLSILLAFGIDALWDERQEAARQAEQLESVLAEFESNLDALPRFTNRHERLVQSVVELYGRLQGAGGEGVVEVPDSLLVWALVNNSFEPSDGALSALIQSAGLQRIRNPALRDALASWPRAVANAAENELRQGNIERPAVMDALASQVDFLAIATQYRPDGPLGSAGMVQLRPSLELQNRLGALLISSTVAASEQRELHVLGDSIVVMLRGS